MKTIELFAGAGGAALGLHRAGFRHVACIEQASDACATLRAAGLPALEADVREYEGAPVPMLWASPPCQPYSQAGKRRAQDDSRNLWPDTLRILDRVNPRWFVMENVRGLTYHRKGCKPLFPAARCAGCYLERVILPELRARFPYVWHGVLNAADYGTPQHRRRLFVVAGPVPFAPPAPTHGPTTSTPWVSCGAALGRVVIGGGRNPQSSALAHTRTYRDLTGEPSVTITACMVGNRGPFTIDGGRNSKANPGQERVVGSGEPAPTIGTRGNQVVRSPEGKRCLQPAECAILQGFPPSYPWQGSTKRSLYRQVGNAVPPQLSCALGRAILQLDQEHTS